MARATSTLKNKQKNAPARKIGKSGRSTGIDQKNKGENPNRFPEESLSDQQALPDEGDDKKAAMEDGSRNDVN